MDWRSPMLIAYTCSIAIALPFGEAFNFFSPSSTAVATTGGTPATHCLPSSPTPRQLLQRGEPPQRTASPAPHLPVEQLHQVAESLTVKVLSKDVLGSGILIQKQGSVYTVLTNEHVLRAAKLPYRIQTPDGQIYPAELSKTTQFQGNDLALLEFRSISTVYAVASLGASSRLAVGDEVFAAGFPFAESASPRSSSGFVFAAGQVSLVLDKALEGGYQVGYTNNVKKGMSGGPLLNRQGKVVGINGMHADPLWDAPDLYQDGSEPCPPLQDIITRSSWAIPMETVVQLAKLSNKRE